MNDNDRRRAHISAILGEIEQLQGGPDDNWKELGQEAMEIVNRIERRLKANFETTAPSKELLKW